MLIRFNVSNFLSFDSEQELSMLPGKVEKFRDRLIQDNELNILKFCALYGANASGKSNLIKALDFAKKVVTKGFDGSFQDSYCKLKKENKEKESKFEFEFKISDSYYAYGFNVNINKSIILGEWLYRITPSKEIMIFERDMSNKQIRYDIKFENDDNKSKFDVYTFDIMNMNSVLLISELFRKNLRGKDFDIFNSIYIWFINKLTIIYSDTVIGEFVKVFDNKNETNITQLLNYFDTGISDYMLEDSNIEEMKKILSDEDYVSFLQAMNESSKEIKQNKKIKSASGTIRTDKHLYEMKYENDKWVISKLLFKHGKACNTMFEFGEESDGTRRLIELIDVIHSDNEDKIFVIDELDRSLHPKMTKKFVETFFKVSKTKKTQLIISTHESNLLDLEFLRRDEIWFVERDKDYSSRLYSLENFKVRYDKKVDKAYLEGRCGAVPVFKNFESYIGDRNEKCESKNS